MQERGLVLPEKKHHKTEKKLDYLSKTCIINEKALYDTRGKKGRKSDASLLVGGFLTFYPTKNMSKQPFFEEKCADYGCF